MGNFSARCPEYNRDNWTRPIMTSIDGGKPVMCKACAVRPFPSLRSADRDPRPGLFFVEIAWGHNIKRRSNGSAAFMEEIITGYKIFMSDAFGHKKGDTNVTV